MNDAPNHPLERLFGRILSPFERFLRRTTAGGIVLMSTTLLTLGLANSPWREPFLHLWELPVVLSAGDWRIAMSLHHWINEGLMALFFLLVGLELKRELLVGELASARDAALPVVSALGGMVVPGLIYYLVNPEGPALAGWGIPTATDIAFAVGILVLLAWRVPKNLIVFLTALAIADDLGAVAVIAIFYTAEIHWLALVTAAGILGLLLLLNRGGVRHPLPYGLLGVGLWLAFLDSGIHATLAGVLLAFAIPARPAYTLRQFQTRLDELSTAFHIEIERPEAGQWAFGTDRLPVIAENLERDATRVQSPQQRIEHGLTPWVNFAVIPLFALANAGIDFSAVHAEALLEPVTLGVLGGLTGGKFIGIAGASYLAVRLGRCRLPAGVRWRHLLGASWLAGIGFTMSLFIAELAFPDQPALVEQAKMGILGASLLSSLVGLSWLYLAAPSRDPSADET